MAFDIGDKYGDSRDVEKIISDLEFDIECIDDDIKELKEELEELEDSHSDEENGTQEERDDIYLQLIKEKRQEIESKEAEKYDVQEELDKYTDFRDEFEGYCDNWKYGATLIHENYFTDYIKNDLIPDVYGEVFENLPSWLESNINWEGVAEDFQVDYTSGTIDNVTYWAV